MEGNSCGLGTFTHSLGQRAGCGSDRTACQGDWMRLHGSTPAQQWPPFMGNGAEGVGGGGLGGEAGVVCMARKEHTTDSNSHPNAEIEDKKTRCN